MHTPQLTTYEHALLLLNQREHACAEIAVKLKQKGHSEEDIDNTIRQLKELNYLNDERFAEIYVRSKANRSLGPTRIKQELLQKGLSSDIAKNAIEEAEFDWYELAKDAKIRKFGEESTQDYKEKSKQMRHLQYRGFDYEQIQYALSQSDRES
ncbi:regulatory protein RecX [Marinomonas posidonica]|uniref:Regulatory protein RecX n=1 Tax=Marinomonas posidonica (strain CECT 7376 / NCIMB 14433 / IVIA-Po-181) TaxID=491952 RepID=F6D105_MARPP|nr:regulatory protein RecX [Marinomonas posidonica]AEF53728.1 Regulatory protein recX [Marinomonas posidonica IVIA-Po-181]